MHAPPLQLRRAKSGDAAALARFAARTFTEAFGAENRPEDLAAHLTRSFGVAQQSIELADPKYITLVMEGPDGIAAYAQVRLSVPPPCVETIEPIELLRFYVDRRWHGQGVAQQLMEEVFAAAAELGGRSVWLSVWERNPRAIAFYLKRGFRDSGSAHFYVGDDRQSDRILVAAIVTEE